MGWSAKFRRNIITSPCSCAFKGLALVKIENLLCLPNSLLSSSLGNSSVSLNTTCMNDGDEGSLLFF